VIFGDSEEQDGDLHDSSYTCGCFDATSNLTMQTEDAPNAKECVSQQQRSFQQKRHGEIKMAKAQVPLLVHARLSVSIATQFHRLHEGRRLIYFGLRTRRDMMT